MTIWWRNSRFAGMDLVRAFTDFIAKERLFAPGDRLLLAVSGGLDSVVLTELCHRCGFDFVIVHCNFRLRGAESQRDEDFVKGMSARYGREVRVGGFETAEYAADKKVSLQVAAREQRYRWFEGLILEGVGRCVLTAHHLDDNIETSLMNFFKGTGIAGLRGMLPKQGNVVRPLLFATREQLRDWAVAEALPWVEDSSNESDKYTRNFFRHQLIPLVEKAYPAALSNLADNLGRFRETEVVYRQAIEERKKKLLEYRAGEVHVPVEKLRKAEPLATMVYELFGAFGFSPQQVGEIVDLMDSGSGKYVLSRTHRILNHRNWLIVTPMPAAEAAHILIEESSTGVDYRGGVLRLDRLEAATVGSLDQGPDVALLDAGQIVFPLLLRRWAPGDYFYPLGLRKKKKIARFLIDSRVSLADKEKVWVLEMDKKIIWVVGRRIDDRWKVAPGCRTVLRIALTREDVGGSSG